MGVDLLISRNRSDDAGAGYSCIGFERRFPLSRVIVIFRSLLRMYVHTYEKKKILDPRANEHKRIIFPRVNPSSPNATYVIRVINGSRERERERENALYAVMISRKHWFLLFRNYSFHIQIDTYKARCSALSMKTQSSLFSRVRTILYASLFPLSKRNLWA